MSKTGRVYLEIAAVVGLLFACIWLAPRLSDDRLIARRIGTACGIGAGTIGLAVAIFRGEKLRELGVSLWNFPRAAVQVAGPTLLVVTGLLIVGYFLESWHFTEKAFRLRPSRWLWPVVQQYFVQSFLNRRWQELLGRGWRSVLLTALIFSLLHFPNPALMVATFLAGTFWAWSFQREPNIWALALSHMALAFVLKYTLPLAILPNLRVGWAYWR
ncbi:MAG: CPBP family intramembrane glutamic endopeptidase [Verrucomicrobiota bacterium]